MPLLKIKDFDPDYKDTFGGYDLKGLDVYSDVNNEKIGTISDLLVDDQGHFRYFLIDLGFWGFGKKVLMPVGRTQIDSDGRHMRALGFTKEQAENLPEFNDSLKIDDQYEERVRGSYRKPPVSPQVSPLEASAPLDSYPAGIPAAGGPMPMGNQTAGYPPTVAPDADRYYQQQNAPARPPVQPAPVPGHSSYSQPGYSNDMPAYNYQQDPDLYGMNEQNHSILQRYEQRLISKRSQAR